MVTNWIQAIKTRCDHYLIFHQGNIYLSWCWNSWIDLYNNIFYVLCEHVRKFEMNPMNMEYPKTFF